MAKKQKIDLSKVFTDIKEQISLESSVDSKPYIPDIIEFCNSKKYLNLPSRNIELYPMQKIILKTFYRGQEGNEHIKLTDEELELLRKEQMHSIMDKYNSDDLFRELVLVLGRRSGKDFMVSLMALYETMRLLEVPGGCPYKYYGIAPGNPIYILTVATSADQARILFDEIKEKLQTSQYFQDKIITSGASGIGAERVWLLTPEDKKRNKIAIEQGMSGSVTKGSVVIMSGHSNSDSLLGKGYYCCDEDTLILSNKGLVPIKDLSDQNPMTPLNNIFTYDTASKANVDMCFCNGKKKVLRITTRSGNQIKVTPDHEMYIWNGKFQFVASQNLQIGDYLVGNFGKNMWGHNNVINFTWEMTKKFGNTIKCPICQVETTQLSPQHLLSHGLTSKQFREMFPASPMRSDTCLRSFNNMKNTTLPTKITHSLSRLLGYFIAEGNNTHKRINIINTEEDIISDILRCAVENFDNVSTTERSHKNKNWANSTNITINGRKEYALFEHLGCLPVLGHEKEIPQSILSSSKDNVVEFLKAYFEGDGHVSKSKNRIFCNSTSEKLIRQIYHVLINFGILSSYHVIYLNNPNARIQYALHINGCHAKKFVEEIGFIGKRKRELAELLIKRIQSPKQNLFGFPVSALIRNTNMQNLDKLSKYKEEYGFYGFSNQSTQSLSMIRKWHDIYQQENIKTDLDKISNGLFADPVIKIEEDESIVYDLHVDSENHAYTGNSLINHNCLLFDEVASFKTTGSSTSGERLYAALGPGTVAFNKKIYEEKGRRTVTPKNKKKAKLLLDEKGFPLRRLDSKVISISSPRAEQGIFYNLYKTASEESSRLAFRLPTWKVNLGITEELLRNENKYMSSNAFQMEFGAEFSGTAGEKFILDKLVDDASQIGEELGLTSQQIQGRKGMVYYAHLDPAATSHNYALIVLHVEERIQVKENEQGRRVKEKVKMFVVDHIKVWYPKPDQAINVNEVDKYIINLSKRFRFNMVSYDSWDSRSSILKLRSKGIPTKMTPFRKQYKMAIYNQLEDLLVNHQLALPFRGPHADEMKMELKCLKRIYTPVGFKIQPDPEAAITTDDICDALAGACGVATETTYGGYAKGGTVYMPHSPQSGSRTWNMGRGSYNSNLWQIINRKFGKF